MLSLGGLGVLWCFGRFASIARIDQPLVWVDSKEASDLKLRKLEPPALPGNMLETVSSTLGSKSYADAQRLGNSFSRNSEKELIPADNENLPKDASTSGHLRVLTALLSPAYLNAYYVQRVHVSGGMPPYHFQIHRGAVPAGLYLDEQSGVLYGWPEHGAVEKVTLEILDSAGDLVRKEFLLITRNKAVMAENGPLQILPQKLQDITVGRRYFAELFTEGGSHPFRFRLVSGSLPPGIELLTEEGILFGRAAEAGSFPFEIEVTDGIDGSNRKGFQIDVKDSPLYLTTPSLPEGHVGVPYSYILEAEGGMPSYRWSLRSGEWPEGLRFDSESGQVAGVPHRERNVRLIIGVQDKEGSFDSAEFTLVVRGGALSVSEQELPAGVVGRFYHIQLKAGGGQPPYKWNLLSNLPAGLDFSGENGVLSGIPKEPFDDQIKVRVEDQTGQQAEISLRLIIIEKPLTLLLPSMISMAVGEFLFFPITAEGGSPDYVWRLLEGSPHGFQILDTGILAGIPSSPAKTLVKIQVVDQSGETRSGSIPVEVRNEDLKIVTGSLPPGQYLSAYHGELSGRGGNLPYRWSINPGNLPDGLALDGNTGVISGTAQEHGFFNPEVTLLSKDGRSVRSNLQLHIAAGQLNILTRELSSGYVGRNYDEVIEVAGGLAPYRWQIISGGLPQGLFLDGAAGSIQGLPVEGRTVEFEMEVADATGERAAQSYRLTIEGDELKIETAFLEEAAVSKPYQHAMAAKGGIAPYRWSIVEGTFPPLLTLDTAAGIFSGIPQNAGEFSILMRVEDASGEYAAKPFTLNVRPEPLHFLTSTLHAANLGENYEADIEVSGGLPPYHWTLTGGFLPNGLQLLEAEGSIRGIPEEIVVDETLSFEVTDEAGERAKQSFIFTVTGVYPSPVQKFILAPSESKMGLAWIFPSDPTVSEVRVYRGRNSWPEISSESLIYLGIDDQMVDTRLLNGQEYFYIVLTYNAAGIASEITDTNRGSAIPETITISGPNDPYADQVVSFAPLSAGGFGAASFPNNVLGAPAGGGDRTPQYLPTELLSLHARANKDGGISAPYGGSIVLEFSDNIVVNGPGADFTVFENAFFAAGDFSNRYIEPAVVSVSQDGLEYFEFPFDYVPHFDLQGKETTNNPYSYAFGFAGKEPVYSAGGVPDPTNPAVSGGDAFDLSWITAKNLKWIRFVKIKSTGDNWLTDRNGHRVQHTDDAGALSGTQYSGFDLDAVSAVHY